MPKKNQKNKENFGRGVAFACRVGDTLEEAAGSTIKKRDYVPVLEGEPMERRWYRVPLPEGLCADGSDYYIYIHKGTSRNLCLFFSGGGLAWNRFTAAHPTTAGKMLTRLPNYYWSNLRPVTQLMNVGLGITNTNSAHNPFYDWNFVIVTYATADLHIGNSSFSYLDEEGVERVLHFHGMKNVEEAMKKAACLFPDPEKILVAGNSAGAFEVAALSGYVKENYYPGCRDITVLSDSGQLVSNDWKHIARDLWNSPKELVDALEGKNPTLDWFRLLNKKHPGAFRCLYASSVFDFILSAYYNDLENRVFRTDEEVQQEFRAQLVQMVHELREINPQFGFFLNNWKIPGLTMGGTTHTSVRENYFTRFEEEGVTMSQWLSDAVYGNVYSVGMHYLKG